MTILTGQTLLDRYRILHPLTHGTYGAVYRAVDLEVGRNVAIKEYLGDSAELEFTFRSIVQKLMEIDHPQLPTVYDLFVLDEIGQYVVTEYVDGIDLQSLIDQYTQLPLNIIIPGAQAACLPLAHMHEHHLYHLNVKPSNIRITPDGDIYLVDFGLPGMTITRQSRGYAAPEQFAGEVSDACDIYAVGATVYTALTGVVPSSAKKRLSGEAEILPIHELNDTVPEYVSDVVSRALELEPKARYRSIETFSRALGSHGAAAGIEIFGNIFSRRKS
jgi:serine/threonine-protein kinase